MLDLGAGTGKLTRGLLALGLDVTAVEPDPAMRAFVPSPATVLDGRGEAIPLPDASVDAVLVGQAFHWFDRPRALAEIARVLRAGGRLGLLWNLLDDTVPWVAEVGRLAEALDRRTVESPPPFTDVPGFHDPVQLRVPHTHELDADELAANVLSRSGVLLREPAEREAVLAAVRAVTPPGRFPFPYVCDTWVAERVPR